MNIRRFLLASLVGAGVVGSAHAVYVSYSTGVWDPRYLATGCTYSTSVTNAVSFGMWVKDIGSMAGDDLALGGTAHVSYTATRGNRRGFGLAARSNGKIRGHVYGDDASGTRCECSFDAMPDDSNWRQDGKWHFLMLTADCKDGQGAANIYIDGELKATASLKAVTFASQRVLQFGGGVGMEDSDTPNPTCDNYGCGGVFTWAEVSLYDRALTADEVRALMTRRANPFDAHLVGYWPCTEKDRGATAINWAMFAVKRVDGSVANAKSYYTDHKDDSAFFPLPSGRFVVTPEWASAHGYVPADDTPANTLGCPATNLPYAFGKLANGETLNIAPGTYVLTETLTYSKTGTTLASYDPETGKGDRAGTVIDCCNAGSTFVAKNNASFNPGFRELTFKDGERAMQFESAGAARIDSCTFKNFTTTGMGGAIMSYVLNGTLITNCLFQSCTARNGGAIYTMQNNRLSENDYQTVIDCRFENCKATQAGGSEPGGGAIFAARNIQLFSSTFKNCCVEHPSGSGRAGVIFAGTCSTIAGCTFTGACYAKSSSGSSYGGLMDIASYHTTISNCVITGISEFHGGYGAIHYSVRESGYSGGDVIYGLICTNNAINASLLFIEDVSGTVTMRNSLVARGDSTGPTALTIGHNSGCAVFEHVTSDLGTLVGTSGSSSRNIFVNCIGLGTINSSGNHVSVFSNCVVSVERSGADDWNVWQRNPGFVDAANGDYTLKPGAFAREKGQKLDWQTNASVDLAGLPRLVNRGGVAYADDALPDLGCYEAQVMMPGMLFILR